MSVNPHQRILISLEYLNVLRSKLLRAYSISIEGEELPPPNNKNNPYYTLFKDDILRKTGVIISEGTLFKFFHDDIKRVYEIITIETIKKYIHKHDTAKNEAITLENWNVITNVSTPQWADYLKIPIEGGLIKRIRCEIRSTSKYYRFGFKLFRINGKLFGDGSIQSMDNNFVIHLGKNLPSDELFITTYKNGIRERSDKYINVKPLNNKFSVELFIDNENCLYFYLNEKEVFKTIINKEIRKQIYMLVWGDENEYQLSVENIDVEFSNE